MKLYIIIIYFILKCFYTSFAQNNAVYIEGLGNSGYFSFGYERTIIKYNQLNFNIDIGFSTYKILDFDKKFNPDYAIPILVKGYYYLHPKHALFAGTGILWSSYIDVNNDNKPNRFNNIYWNTNWGYNFEWSKRIRLQAYYVTLKSINWEHWFGFKIAYKW